MITHKDHFHGSDLEKIEKIYGIKKEDIISFSANVNPLGISPLMRERLTSNLDCISTYPDREYTALRDSIGNYNSCDANDVIVGNGT
ncbi:MAG: threonine-phosphate decarboxylase, partial [Lachnospiraceae bacterium]|nr:threonine-phosphate decarboxylase [Lachnospiraceae bacterium]